MRLGRERTLTETARSWTVCRLCCRPCQWSNRLMTARHWTMPRDRSRAAILGVGTRSSTICILVYINDARYHYIYRCHSKCRVCMYVLYVHTTGERIIQVVCWSTSTRQQRSSWEFHKVKQKNKSLKQTGDPRYIYCSSTCGTYCGYS